MSPDARHPLAIGLESLGITEPDQHTRQALMADPLLHSAVFALGQYAGATTALALAVRRYRADTRQTDDVLIAAGRLARIVDAQAEAVAIHRAIRPIGPDELRASLGPEPTPTPADRGLVRCPLPSPHGGGTDRLGETPTTWDSHRGCGGTGWIVPDGCTGRRVALTSGLGVSHRREDLPCLIHSDPLLWADTGKPNTYTEVDQDPGGG